MDIDVKTWLYDILNAINEIESFFLAVVGLFDQQHLRKQQTKYENKYCLHEWRVADA